MSSMEDEVGTSTDETTWGCGHGTGNLTEYGARNSYLGSMDQSNKGGHTVRRTLDLKDLSHLSEH